MKKILTLILLIIVTNTLKAQTDIDTLELINTANKSDYVFEGEVTEICYYTDVDDNIYTNYIINISRFVKGQISCGTISIISRGGSHDDRITTPSHTTQFTRGFKGIFFCKDNDIYPNPTTECNIQTDNPKSLTMTFNEHAYIGYYTDFINEVAEGQNSQFHTLQELYDFINTYTSFNLVTCNPMITANVNSYENKRDYRSIPFTNNKQPIKKTRTNDILLDLSNPTITGGADKYYEFDVNISSFNNSTYLDECAFRIKYDTNALGSNIATSTIINLGNNFLSSTYTSIQKIDFSNNVISIWIHQASSGQPRTNITGTAMQLLHFKCPLPNCQVYPNVLLDTFTNIKDYAYYTTTSTASSSSALQYDFVYAIDTLVSTLCYPQITDVISSKTGTNTTAAGINDTITVKGKNFGSNVDVTTLSLNGAGLLLKNADDGGATYFPIQNYDIVNWNDTLIKFKLYSLCDSTDNNLVFQSQYAVCTPGSGNIRVVNRWFLYDTNSVNQFIGIKYGLISDKWLYNGFNYYKNNQYLFGFKPDSTHRFRFNTNVTNDTLKWCVKAAINKWRCLTGVNFVLDSIISPVKAISGDYLSIIILDTTDNPDAIIETTPTASNRCLINTNPTPSVFGTKDIDIVIKDFLVTDHHFFYDTTGTKPKPANKYDFYQNILHELGHALLQKHVNNENDIMFFKGKYTDYIPASNRNIIFNNNNKVGGRTIVLNSYTTNLFDMGCMLNFPIAIKDTCNVNVVSGINSITDNNLNFIAYPNPARNTIHFSLPLTDEKTIKIYDVTGKMITVLKTNSNLISYSIANLQKGIYFAELNTDSKRKIIKFICD